ncbi:PREDICTED: rhombotin-1-like [Acanthisitta chloris]|uniref:rhombotin-1-like n=1 Tax=Acanthisitta chloris TaxID=57068 RepID=UPI0004F0D951|nr:PREDICTED: rhombotin-1-like [Acanthisitta chloris]
MDTAILSVPLIISACPASSFLSPVKSIVPKFSLILWREDFLRLFGTTGNCAACSKLIPAFEMVMRARDNVYHLDCFACQLCNQRFCVGDKFFLKNNMILCQMDYEEGQLNGSFESQVQ